MYDVTAIGEVLIDFTPDGVNEQGIARFQRETAGQEGGTGHDGL